MNIIRAGRSRHETLVEIIMLGFVLLVASGMAGLFGLMVDVTLLAHGMSSITVLFASHALSGLLLSSLYWHRRERLHEQQEIHDDRLNKVALMNHYVRNALSVLAFYGRENPRKGAQDAVKRSIARIEWALTDVLPRGWNIDHLIAKPFRPKMAELKQPPSPEETDARRAG